MRKPKIKIEPLALPFLFFLFLANPLRDLLLFFSAALWHECGHFLAGWITRNPAACISLCPFGMKIEFADSLQHYKNDLFLALCGPLFNFSASLALLFLLRIFPDKSLFLLFYSHLFLCFFNLLPLFSFDGGRMLFALLALSFDADRAQNFCRAVSFVFSALLFVGGVLLFLSPAKNASLLFLSLVLLAEESTQKNKATNFYS